jgi:branched-chain amino acid transport system permease protein
MNYLLHLLILFELYVMLAMSLNLMVGYTGLVSLAHAAFYGIGAYLTTLMMVDLGLGFLPSLVTAACGTIVLSLLISLASLRFRGDYFILSTLAFQVIIFTILYNWIDVTRGSYGIPDIPRPSIAGIRLDSLPSFAIFGLVITSVVVGFFIIVFRSPFGRTLQSIRDDEIAATSLGKHSLSFKARSVAITSGCAAIAGGLYATYVTFIDPNSFTTEESMLLLSMVVIGGTGNIRGPIVGAIILIVLPEMLRFLYVPDAIAANLRLIIYGLLLVIIMRYRPQGIAGRYGFE